MTSAFSHTAITCDSRALLHNVRTLEMLLPTDVKSMWVVKGDAYGHGIENIVPSLSTAAPDYYAVFTVEEVIKVRVHDSLTPILVLQPVTTELVHSLARHTHIHFSVSSFEALRTLAQHSFSKKIHVHLCIESGLGRDGIEYEDMKRTFICLQKASHIRVAGLYTHFSGAESRAFDIRTEAQVERLQVWRDECHTHNMNPIVHSSGTVGAFLGHFFDMCRFGIGLYGLWPSEETKHIAKKRELRPVLRMTTRIVEVKKIKKGSGIGYDESYSAPADMIVAVVPVGYANGLPRTLSSNCNMLVRGVRAPVCGRIMMNMCVLDVSHIQRVKILDEVVIVGTQGKECISVDEIATRAETINYELVTRLRA